MSDQPGRREEGAPASDGSAASGPDRLEGEDVQLAEPSVSAEVLEPTLDTAADEVALSEPSLEPAEISRDSAEAASLDEVAAEAEFVAREAEDVGTLVAGPRPPEDPANDAAPAGTAPAGGTAGDAETPPAGDADSEDTAGDPEEDAAGDPEDAAGNPGEEATGHSSSEEQERALADLTAAGNEPEWLTSPQDQARWDALFEAGQAAAEPAGKETHGAPAEPAPEPAAEPAPEPAAAPAPAPADAPMTSAAPESPWAQPFGAPGQADDTATQDGGDAAPPVGGAYAFPPAGAEDAPPSRSRARAVGRAKNASRKGTILIVVAAVVVGLLILAGIGIVNAVRDDGGDAVPAPGSTPGADGVIAEDISALDLEAGDCVLDFDPADVSGNVTTVTCVTPHNAQLLATTSLADDADFPGDAALGARGDELCNSVAIDQSAAAEYGSLTLTKVTPTQRTWAEGDRRIDCFVVAEEAVVTDSLLGE